MHHSGRLIASLRLGTAQEIWPPNQAIKSGNCAPRRAGQWAGLRCKGFDPNRKRAGVYPLPVKWLPVSTAVNSYITVCMMLAWCTIRCGGMLDTSMAVVEHDQAGAHGSRPPPGQPAPLD